MAEWTASEMNDADAEQAKNILEREQQKDGIETPLDIYKEEKNKGCP